MQLSVCPTSADGLRADLFEGALEAKDGLVEIPEG